MTYMNPGGGGGGVGDKGGGKVFGGVSDYEK